MKSGSQILDTIQIITRIYMATNEERPQAVSLLKKCRLNPDYSKRIRNDVAYYIPQLINYMVFHSNMSNEQIMKFILQTSENDFFFAHQVYFQLLSLSQIVEPKRSIELKAVKRFLSEFESNMTDNYKNTILIAMRLYEVAWEFTIGKNSQKQSIQDLNKAKETQSIYKGRCTLDQEKKKSNIPEDILEYGTKFYSGSDELLVKAHQIYLDNYSSVFEENKYSDGHRISDYDKGFCSTIDFWNDLFRISQRLSLADPKIISLKADLQKLNQCLPAAVYIPFTKDAIRNYVILNIVPDESRVFSTKARSPFSLCIEVYRPELEQDNENPIAERNGNINQIINDPVTLKMLVTKRQQISELKRDKEYDRISKSLTNNYEFTNDESDVSPKKRKKRLSLSFTTNQYDKELKKDLQTLENKQDSDENSDIQQFRENRGISCFYASQIPDQKPINTSQNSQTLSLERPTIQNPLGSFQSLENSPFDIVPPQIDRPSNPIHLSAVEHQQLKKIIFGESSQEQSERVKRNSPFRQLQSWKLVNIIVKTDDNLKQEQFALQLINQFSQIFEMEGLPLKLTYYEVQSLGPDCGIIEMVKDAATIDALKRNLNIHRRDLTNFSVFFKSYFQQNYQVALNNYIESLVAYCLVTYFLQVKDRHNGNILLLSDGRLMHIDFGFFLSNAPGKGIEFESKVPFKLLSEHIQVLGGPKSSAFEHFRKLFFKGFQAAQKHQNKILILVKMMYSGHGTTLPCFRKGEQAIVDLEARFNPPVEGDGDLSIFIQELINASLDNWRARWYDKFQYYFQGIFY